MGNIGSNRKIALNTCYMYVRLLLTMAIGLYTSRIVLMVLGISDYGLFNVVGGILATFTFISGSLSAATSRFFNVEMGKHNGDLNLSYNINLLLHLLFAIIVLLLAETIGLWYVYNKLNVGTERLDDAVFVYHISIVSVCVGIISSPCYSLFTAFEKFAFLAKFDIANTIVRLIGVIYLQFYDGNVLRLYTIIMCLTSVNTIVVYYSVAKRRWPEIIKIKFVKGWRRYMAVLSFGGWNLLSTIALMIRSSGCDLIINNFFNTAINGAFAISKTVNNYITTFSTNFDSASGPQIIQSYSSGEYGRCTYLVNKMGRFSLLLFEIVFFPLYIELDFVLELWLKEVPANVSIFCQLNLLLAGVALTCGGLVQYINASGKIKWFKINGSFFFIACVPIGFWLYSSGAPAYSILCLFLIADIIQRVVQLYLMKIIINFDSWKYVREAYGRPIIIAIIMSAILYCHSFLIINKWYIKAADIVICFITTIIFVYLIGLTSREKRKIASTVSIKLHKFV